MKRSSDNPLACLQHACMREGIVYRYYSQTESEELHKYYSIIHSMENGQTSGLILRPHAGLVPRDSGEMKSRWVRPAGSTH